MSVLAPGVAGRSDFPGMHPVGPLPQRLCSQVQVGVLTDWDAVNEGATAMISADQTEYGVTLWRRGATLAGQGDQASDHFYWLCLFVGSQRLQLDVQVLWELKSHGLGIHCHNDQDL